MTPRTTLDAIPEEVKALEDQMNPKMQSTMKDVEALVTSIPQTVQKTMETLLNNQTVAGLVLERLVKT